MAKGFLVEQKDMPAGAGSLAPPLCVQDKWGVSHNK